MEMIHHGSPNFFTSRKYHLYYRYQMLSPKSYLNFFIRFYFFATTTDTTESHVYTALCISSYWIALRAKIHNRYLRKQAVHKQVTSANVRQVIFRLVCLSNWCVCPFECDWSWSLLRCASQRIGFQLALSSLWFLAPSPIFECTELKLG